MRVLSSPNHQARVCPEKPSESTFSRWLVVLLALFFFGFTPAASAQVCGDTVLDAGEDCEAPFDACCNPTTCLFEPVTTVCLAGSGDACDPDEMCTGTSDACPSDTVLPGGTECYGGSGDLCDPARQCTGVATDACPAPATEPLTTVCRSGSGDLCDPEELCTGNAGEACPGNVVLSFGTECYAGSGDLCDPAKQCSGVATEACPAATTEPATAVCRGGSGDLCDPDELCTGNAGEACPADNVSPPVTVCRLGSGDSCDPDELCTGAAGQACPSDTVSPVTQVCRPGSGDSCDPDESCTGAAGQPCPSDTISPATQVCRTGSGDSCDPDELCTGSAGAACPSDTVSAATEVCRTGSGDACDPDESCSGNVGEACPADTISPATQICRTGSGDSCDADELCTGNAGEECPSDVVSPDTQVCRTGSGDACDPDELCSGTAGEECPTDVVSPATLVCRPGSGDPNGSGVVCDADETCTGTAGEECPTDVFEPVTTVCRTGSGDVCDPDEVCPGGAGAACPVDDVEPDTTVCRVGAGDPNGGGFVCDPDELCTGAAGQACPTDGFSPAGTVCNPGGGDPTGSGFVCDPDEQCPGGAGSVCPPDTLSDAETVCRAGSGSFDGEVFTCDASERCTGAADEACPIDVNFPVEAGLTLRATRDARTMETHRSSNNGATGLFWLKRSPNVRGLIGFDLSCQGAGMETLDCGLLGASIHDGTPTVQGSTFSVYQLNVDWVEGNQAFDSFNWSGQSLGSFPGSGSGTTWNCRIDSDLEAGGSSECSQEDMWSGGNVCGTGACYTLQSTDEAPYVETSQKTLGWNVTDDIVANAAPVSWLLKVTDETNILSGSVKLYQRDGARFIAETDESTPPHEAFARAPRLLLYGPNLVGPSVTLVEPASQGAIGSTIDVAMDQTGVIGGDPPRWNNKTMDKWGYMDPGVLQDWEATVPLQSGPNEVEFTVYDACNTEGRATYTLTSAQGEFCGNGIIEAGEQCDDGNGISGDCCSGTCQTEPEGAVCNDGDICTSASTCTAGSCIGTGRTPAACGDSYMCYKAAVTRGTFPFFPVSKHDLTDAFGANEGDIRLAQAICIPGSVEAEPVLSPVAHRVGYKMKERTSRPLPPAVKVTDRFGTITVDPLKVSALLSPAGYQLDGPATPLGSGIIDHHECYTARMSLGKYPKGTKVEVADSLEQRTYNVLKPGRLCLAVDSDGAGVMNPNAHLMCYRVSRTSGESKHQKVRKRIHVIDEFGTLELDTRRESELCVPATIDSPIL